MEKNNFRQRVLEDIKIFGEELGTLAICLFMVVLMFLYWAFWLIIHIALGLAYILESPFAFIVSLIRNKNSFIVIPFLQRVRSGAWLEKLPMLH